MIGIGCFVVVSVVVILVATAALCRRKYLRKEMMNNFKVREREDGVCLWEREDGVCLREGEDGVCVGGRGWCVLELEGAGEKKGVAMGTIGLCAQCSPM